MSAHATITELLANPTTAPVRRINRTPITIIEDLRDAARREKEAAAERVELEEELVGALRLAGEIDARQEGAQTVHVDHFKVVVTAKLSRKPTKGGLDKIQTLGLGDLTPVKTKIEVDETGLKYLAANEPQIYAKVAPFIETKPAKTSVTVTRED